MDIQGTGVHSSTFGKGTVLEQTETMITVDFGGVVKKFLYPSGFEAFLEADDPAVQTEIMADITTEKAKEARRQRTEHHKAMYQAERDKAAQQKKSGKAARRG